MKREDAISFCRYYKGEKVENDQNHETQTIKKIERAWVGLVTHDDLTDELSKFLEGFKMTYCNQVAILEKYGVKAIDGNNKPFDPNFHQAVLTEHRDGVNPGMVLEVLQKGYLLKDKVIRHAMVKVSD